MLMHMSNGVLLFLYVFMWQGCGATSWFVFELVIFAIGSKASALLMFKKFPLANLSAATVYFRNN